MNTAIEIISTLKFSGFEAYLVGGAVRDFLLEKIPKDFDVATSAEPEQVKLLFGRTIDTGIQHGTVLVLINGNGVEVTTFRTESNYSDNRRPDIVQFVKSLEEDLKRRDFTINAMAMTENLELIDYFDGQRDLKVKLIRAVGEPAERFQEDALRMLRAVRFSGQLDFSIEDQTLSAIQKNASLIQSIAIERIKIELNNIFSSLHVACSVDYLIYSGLADHLPSGDMFYANWKEFVATKDPLRGWLYALWQNKKDVSALSAYKFSNEEKTTMRKALEAAQLEDWDQWTYYHFSLQQLELAAMLTHKTENPSSQKNKLSIQCKSAIKVNGRDLMEWSGKKGGPWLKDWLFDIERQIVYNRLENEKDKIKEWFFDEYYRDK